MTGAWHDEEFSELTAEKWEPLEQRVRDFEAALASRGHPDLADFLPDDDPSDGQLLVELIHADLEFRIQEGEHARIEDYLARFPKLAKRKLSLVGLIKAEFEHRSLREPGLWAAEYVERFPHLAEDLKANGFRLAPRSMETISDAGATLARNLDVADENSAEYPAVPGYALIEEIGRGGMGVVYKAIETKLGRLVALKTVLPGADAVDRVRLRREADAAASLQNPNVVQIHHVFEDAGRLYVSCEFLPGGTLARRVARRPLPPKEAAALLEPIARAVSEAHDLGIIHRDLKPSNILIAADGTPKITDFGLSKWIDEDTSLTRTGIVAGSPSYMAPEQALAQKEIGPAVDIWALGAILYELLTGRPPFQAATILDTLEQVRNNEPLSPRKLVPRVPRDLETICLKCLEKNPQRRYRSAKALADDLARFQRGEIVQARPVGVLERATRYARRHPATAGLVLVLGVSIALGAVGLLYHTGQLRELNHVLSETIDDRNIALASETAARAHAEAIRYAAQAAERRTQRLLLASDMKHIAEAIGNGDLRRAEELLQLHRGEATGDYAFVANYLDRLVHAPGKLVDQLPGAVYYVRFSPQGELLAACGQSGEVSLYDTETWLLVERFETGHGEVNALAFSQDDRRMLTVGDDGTVALWDLVQKKELLRRKVYTGQAYQVEFGNNDHLLAVCGRDPKIVFLNAETFEELSRSTVDEEHVEGLAATPDGKTLVVAGRSGNAVAFDFETQAIRWKHKPNTTGVEFMSVSVSPDGKFAAFGSRGSTITLATIKDGSIRRATLAGSALGDDASWYRAVCFLPEDNVLAVGSDAGAVHLAGVDDGNIAAVRDRARISWTAHGDRISCIAANEDVLVTASRDGSIFAWKPAANQAWKKFSLPTESTVASLSSEGASGHPLRLVSVASSSVNGKATGYVFDTSETTSKKDFGGKTSWREIATSRNGNRLFAGSHTDTIAGWDVSGPSPVLLFERKFTDLANPNLGGVTRNGERFAVHFWWNNPNGERESELLIVNGNTGETIASRRFWYGMPSVAFAEDGSLVVAVQEEAILLLEPQTLATRRELRGHEEKVVAITLSQDGKRLASAANDRGVIVWDLATGTQIDGWQADTGRIEAIAFSPNGQLLLSSTRSRPPRLWEIESRRLLLELGPMPEMTPLENWSPAEFTGDGGHVLIGSGRNVLLIDGQSLTSPK